MDLTPYVDHLRHELAVVAEAGGEDTRALAERLSTPLESAARLMLLNALSAAMDEVTQDLAPGSVEVRLRGLDPEFAVTAPPGAEAYEAYESYGEEAPRPAARAPLPPAPAEDEEGGTARINFRLPAHLKARVEEAASREGLSVNAWLVRAAATALEPDDRPRPAARGRRGGQSYTGWVR